MNEIFVQNTLLPSNSWLLDAYADGRRWATGGSKVEQSGNLIAEGAWAGSFDELGVLTSPFRCGSGAVLVDHRIQIFAPTHSVEVVYCFVSKDFGRVVVSNSLAMLSAYEPNYSFSPNNAGLVEVRSNKIKDGVAAYPRALYSNENGQMRVMAWSVHEIDFERKEITESDPFEADAPFRDYASYKDYLLETLASLTANARTAARTAPYGKILTTVSAGYDSSACAALAKELGCTESITLTTSRGGERDSGEDVAAALHMQCYAFERAVTGLEHLANEKGFLPPDLFNASEYDEFFANTVHPNDLVFLPFEPYLSDAIVLTGFHGDKVWAMGCPSGPDIVRGDHSGFGMDEFRRRLGFVAVPVPFIGAKYHQLIADIAASEEMKRFRLEWSRYDRPIPRRMAEEAGVPRKVFGQSKMAGSAHISRPQERFVRSFSAVTGRYREALRGAAAA